MTEGKTKSPEFSHPAEEFFARVLTYYGVEWQYEPKTFPLAWDSRGEVTEAFTPDFYLPQQQLYIEVTTRRPRLNTLKNHKLRKMNELYPDVHIKLFKRRDIHGLLVKFGLYTEAERLEGSAAQVFDSEE